MQDLASEFSEIFRGWYARTLTAGGGDPLPHPTPSPAFDRGRRTQTLVPLNFSAVVALLFGKLRVLHYILYISCASVFYGMKSGSNPGARQKSGNGPYPAADTPHIDATTVGMSLYWYCFVDSLVLSYYALKLHSNCPFIEEFSATSQPPSGCSHVYCRSIQSYRSLPSPEL